MTHITVSSIGMVGLTDAEQTNCLLQLEVLARKISSDLGGASVEIHFMVYTESTNPTPDRPTHPPDSNQDEPPYYPTSKVEGGAIVGAYDPS